MSKIEIQINKFNGNFKNFNCNNIRVNINMIDVIRSFISVGFHPYYGISRHLHNIIFRSFLSLGICYLLDFKQDLAMKNFFFDFDASEKNNISYYLGMTFTKYVYEKQLKIPWLINVDYLIKTGQIKLAHGKSKKGDLIGKDLNGNWHVVEAKGRSNNPEKGLMSRAKNQARKISHINNKPVSTNAGSITNIGKVPINIIVEDPDRDTNNIKIDFRENYSFFKAYYSKYIENMEFFGHETFTYQNNKYDYFTIGIINNKKIIIGLLSSLHKNPENAIEIIKKIGFPKETETDVSIGKDGTIIMIKDMNEIEKYK